MEEDKQLLDEIETHLMQSLDLLDIIIDAGTSHLDKAHIVGPLEILKRDLDYLTEKIDNNLAQYTQKKEK